MIRQYAIFPDVHLCYEGHSYYVMRKILKSIPRLSGIYSLGDYAELESVSRHVKTSVAEDSLLTEFEYVNSHLDWYETNFPKIPFTWILGNHEARLNKWLNEYGRPLIGCLSVASLARLPERRNVRIEPYRARQLVRVPGSKTYLRHEPRKGGKHHAVSTADVSTCNIIYGHTHQVQDVIRKDEFGRIRRSTSLGFLGDQKAKVFEYRGPDDHWASAMGILTVDDKTKYESLQIIHIHETEAFYDGRIIRAKMP